MPISMDEFRFPRLIKYKDKNPFTENVKAKFMDAASNSLRRYHADTFPQPGYNPNSNTPKVRKINLENDNITLPHN
jgi:hypothetical protein